MQSDTFPDWHCFIIHSYDELDFKIFYFVRWTEVYHGTNGAFPDLIPDCTSQRKPAIIIRRRWPIL